MSHDALPFPRSLCHRCKHVKVIRSGKGTVFLMCTTLPRKYLPQPRLRCEAFEAKQPSR
ncbi:MAG: hypothetical protein ACE366_21325 [Bradymonadia bacterium]